jgi:hypothetical protein
LKIDFIDFDKILGNLGKSLDDGKEKYRSMFDPFHTEHKNPYEL